MDHPVLVSASTTESLSLAEPDPSGLQTLERFSGIGNFNRWMYDQIAPFCGGHILEIGSGIGNISAFLLERYPEVSLSDIRPEYCRRLEQAFGGRSSLRGIYPIDLAAGDIAAAYPQLAGVFDTVIALNVVEHIHDHGLAVRNAHRLLKRGGRVVILVPAYKWLYNSLDKELGHFRRYTRRRLADLLSDRELRVVHTQYFNAAAIPGWWVAGSLLKMKEIRQGALRWYDRLVPLFRLTDGLTRKSFGISVIAVAEKTGS